MKGAVGQNMDANNNATVSKLIKDQVARINAKGKTKKIKEAQSKNVRAEVDHVEQSKTMFNDGIHISVNSDEDREYGEDDMESESESSGGEETTEEPEEPMIQGVVASSASEMDEDEEMLKNPRLLQMVDRLLNEKLKEINKNAGRKEQQPSTRSTARGTSKIGGSQGRSRVDQQLIKSPSDTTIYIPALNKYVGKPITVAYDKLNPREVMRQQSNDIGDQGKQVELPLNILQVKILNDGDAANMIDKISNFVESVRNEEKQRRESEVNVPGFDEASDRTEKTIVEVEKFKAAVAAPPGKDFQFSHDQAGPVPGKSFADCQDKLENQQIGTGLTDDDFFRLTCHIEPGLQQKIERGEFVDLDKLLPRDKGFGKGFTDENRMEWVHKEGCTYLAPVYR